MLRFTIRDVLWLMVVVGLGVGWFAHVRAERAELKRVYKFYSDQSARWSAQLEELKEENRVLFWRTMGMPIKPDDAPSTDNRP